MGVGHTLPCIGRGVSFMLCPHSITTGCVSITHKYKGGQVTVWVDSTLTLSYCIPWMDTGTFIYFPEPLMQYNKIGLEFKHAGMRFITSRLSADVYHSVHLSLYLVCTNQLTIWHGASSVYISTMCTSKPGLTWQSLSTGRRSHFTCHHNICFTLKL